MAKMSEEKRAAIKKTMAETKERRKTQVCKVYELKVDKSRCSKQTRASLGRLFLEAKWLRNAILASENLYDFDTQIKEVQVKVGELFESRQFLVLGSQIKQSIHQRVSRKRFVLESSDRVGFCLMGRGTKPRYGAPLP